jgi:hypothetical protein
MTYNKYMKNTALSPEAQAVLDATDYPEDWATRIRVAAALRAAAKELSYGHGVGPGRVAVIDKDELLRVATELDPL